MAIALACAFVCQGRPQPIPDSRPRARVVVVSNPDATEAFKARPDIVRQMVDDGIKTLALRADLADAWRSFVSARDVIGIKVYCLPGPLSGTRPAVVEAVVRGLLEAGMAGTNIVIWDKHAIDLRLSGYQDLAKRLGVRWGSSVDAGYDYQAHYESPIIGNLVWGDYDFGRSAEGLGRKSYLSKIVTRTLTKIINLSPLLNHNVAGVSGNLYSLALGSVDNGMRFEYEPSRLAQAVPEIYALPELSDKVVLNITDALICQYEGGERALLHYSVTPNELWFSKDPVALDSLALNEVVAQRTQFVQGGLKPNYELYSNAALLELGVSDTNHIDVQRVGKEMRRQ